MKVLALDTSNRPLSVAILEDHKILSTFTSTVHRQHARELLPVIERDMNNAGLEPGDLTRIVVAYGPGSYTGIRIASTTAKVLAFTLDIDLVAVSSLQALAMNLIGNEGALVNPVFDARNNNLFTGLYKIKNRVPVSIIKDQHVNLATWLPQLKRLDQPIIGIGDADHFKNRYQKVLGANFKLVPGLVNLPQAAMMGLLGEKMKPVRNINTFVPNYLRLTPAQLHWWKQHPDADRNASAYVDRFNDKFEK